ncbi:hypothetical protein LZ198_29610 [Myxococcus sp. K15C18031901]|uniref:hypothetical protein n=1 Tax=Myxococcus dinghuensis TaxID=2906761 RepID=UPI0020A6E093|nr:hypothetical protein [Myxococcus dinghuensis]MCP3103044.1 hypothetical protein [Myxococcus dinghuensis]
MPLERDEQGTWLSGPRDPAFDQPPLAVHLLQRWQALTLILTANYSYWLEDGEPSALRFKAALERLKELGWEEG